MSDLDPNQQITNEPAKPKAKRGGARPNSGGPRPGSGRPTGPGVQELRNALMTKVLSEYKITPLQYMLAVLNGEHEDARGPADRQWAANAAAPYMHARLSQVNATTDNKHTISTEEAAALTKDIVGSMLGN
jgi:GH18 family chitinase